MPHPCDNSSLDSSTSSPPGNNAFSHDVVPLSQDQREQPPVDRCLSTINPVISQPSCALFNPVVKTTNSQFVYSTSHTANANSIP